MNTPDMKDGEKLGRRLSEASPEYINRIRKNVKEGRTPLCPYQVFKPKPEQLEISVDRISMAPSIEKMAEISVQIAEQNNRIFYGWGILIYRSLPQGFKVRPSPDDFNDYHADLYFTGEFKGISHERDKRKKFAQTLAEIATWLPCPE